MAPRAAIGVGLVGYGLAGRSFHAPLIEAVDGLSLCAIATSAAERIATAGQEHPDAQIVPGVDELLARSDVELVVVAAPNRFHASIATRAILAGRDVVVDKPMAMDVGEADRLIDTATRAGRRLSVFQNRRWDGDFLTVRRLIDDRALGSVDSIEGRFERSSPVGPEWRESAIDAGGPLRDLGSHLIDQSLVLFGPATRVWAQLDRRRPSTQIVDTAFVAIDHVRGVRSRLWASLIASHVGPRVRVRGLEAEYVKQDLDIQERQLLDGMLPREPGFGAETEDRWGRVIGIDGSVTAVPTERGRYVAFYERLRDAVRADDDVPVNPVDSLNVLRVLEAAERAGATGKAQPVRGAAT